jgi:hypothetical protein
MLSCGGKPPSLPGPPPAAVAPAPVVVIPVELAPTPEVGEPSPRPRPTPRARAAYWMLRELQRMAEIMPALVPMNVENGCPTDVMWVTWGVGKTDPWDSPFHLHCDDSTGRKPHMRSAGADRELFTEDDLVSNEPLVSAEAGCAHGCAALAACPATVGTERCAERCAAGHADMHFHVDTCADLPDCAGRSTCVASALVQEPPDSDSVFGLGSPRGDCHTFATAAAATFSGNEEATMRLDELCNQDVLDVAELVCVLASKEPADAALCHLTLDRGWASREAGP